MDATQKWLLDNKKVCTCTGITRKTVVKAIKDGADTVEKVNRATGTGSGSCRGNRCGPLIAEILKENNL